MRFVSPSSRQPLGSQGPRHPLLPPASTGRAGPPASKSPSGRPSERRIDGDPGSTGQNRAQGPALRRGNVVRWKALSPSLDANGRRFVSRLRLLKDRSGLSLVSLQAKTQFSDSSWERYLNGKVLPPSTAVEALARLSGEDVARLMELRDAAAKTWYTASDADSTPGSDTARGVAESEAPRIRAVALSLAAGGLLLSAAVSMLLVMDARQPNDGSNRGSTVDVGTYTCTYSRRGDELFAGNSTTTSRLVMLNSTGPDTAEVQCLLRRHKLSPGDIDGYFGQQTEAQVRRLQRQGHVPADGIVGEQTWTLLRHVE
ncbi:peptidoglycan-binding protein [Streptomyces sp. NPDC019937]|uniref:peptidoglycan-binding protein n=1 Tax=Streptomyces sp. NPDC019937 TaxID=3154787 RepID=UPI0033D9B724